MKMIFSALLTLSSATCFAAQPSYNLLSESPLDFAAPTVYSRTSVTAAPVGTIVYDYSSGTFFGLAPGGNPSTASSWVQFGGTTTSSPITTSGTTERIERAFFGGNSGSKSSPTVCNTTTCTVYMQSGSWVNSVTYSSGTGDYTINFATGEFADLPTCTCDAGESGMTCNIWTYSSTLAYVEIRSTTSTIVAGNPRIICMGPH